MLAFCCLCLVLAVYSPSLDFQFILDDHRFTQDPRIQEPGHVWEYFTNFVWPQFKGGPNSFYRPIFLLWMRISFLLSDLSPWGWHLLSIGKHVVVAGLLGMLVWKLLRHWTAAVGAATLFALHPAHTESVSWVTVPDPLMAAGLLIALLCYLQYLEAPPRKDILKRPRRRKASPDNVAVRNLKWLPISAAAYLMALFAKETAIVFPALVFAIEFVSTAPQPGTSRNIRERSSPLRQAFLHTLPFVLATGLYLALRVIALGRTISPATQHLSWRVLILSWPAILWFYVKAMMWPWKAHSFADPISIEKFSMSGVLLPIIWIAIAAFVLLATSYWAWRSRSGEREAGGLKLAVTIGILFLVLPLLPALNVNGLNPGDFLHGRYTYLPLAGLMLLIAVVWSMVPQRKVLLFVAAALATGFSLSTYGQEKQWKDDLTVFTIGHQLAPHNAVVARNLADMNAVTALHLSAQGRCREAMPILDQVTRDFPGEWYGWAAMGECYVQLNDVAKAEDAMHRAADLSHDPRVIQHWQEFRTQVGLPNNVPAK